MLSGGGQLHAPASEWLAGPRWRGAGAHVGSGCGSSPAGPPSGPLPPPWPHLLSCTGLFQGTRMWPPPGGLPFLAGRAAQEVEAPRVLREPVRPAALR